MVQPITDEQRESQDSSTDATFRKYFSWVILIGATVWGSWTIGFIVYHGWIQAPWLMELMLEHFAALICVPMAALMAMSVVILLRFSVGPIEFRGLGFEFKGAAGQVVFWIFCFLAIVYGFYLLW